jgi:hypothetical protein
MKFDKARGLSVLLSLFILVGRKLCLWDECVCARAEKTKQCEGEKAAF